MQSIREVYFSSLKKIEGSKYITTSILKRLLIKFNLLTDELDLTTKYDEPMKNLEEFNKCLELVLKGKMFEYAINEAVFDQNTLYVDENVLIPRQETEELLNLFINKLKEYLFDEKTISIADICTGSGCLAVSLAKRFPLGKIFATDISEEALKVAEINSKKLGVSVSFSKGNMLDPLVEKGIKVDCIICNPPYIDDPSTIDERTYEQEPHLALMASPATKYYEEVLKDLSKVTKNEYLLAFEIGEEMKGDLEPLLKQYVPHAKYEFLKDMDGKDRFLIIYEKIGYTTAEDALINHGVICFPTETVMGLGILYDDEVAFSKLNRIKRRPENKPYSLMLGNVEDIEKYAFISEDELKVAKAFLPGPLTLLLKKKELPEWVTLDSDYVGIRVPDMPEIAKIINSVGKPILAPSANRSGEAPGLTYNEVRGIFGDEIDFYVEGNALNCSPSTIVVIDKDIKIIREGPISKEQIAEVLK